MEKLLKGYNKDDDLRKLFRSKDDLTKDLLQFKGKSDENDVSQNLGLFSSGLIVSGGKSGVNILKISQVCPAWEAGLRGGDIITEIEGKEINSLEGYVEIMQNLNKTRRLKIALVVHRQGVLYNVSIKRTN
jgi:S1-C subfamily serine protease